MSILGIAGSLFAGYNPDPVKNKFQQAQQAFSQLGQDLQSGNLSKAQNDFSALQPLFPSQWQSGSTSAQNAIQNTNSVSQAISQLGQDLKAGYLSAAQSDFSALQQDLQQPGKLSSHRHHHLHSEGAQSSDTQNSPATLLQS